MKSVVCLLLVTVGSSLAQHFSMGKCNSNLTVQPNFNIKAYLGEWYEQQRFFNFPEEPMSCIRNIFYQRNDSTIQFSVRGTVHQGNHSYMADGVNGVATFPDNSEQAKMVIKFPVVPSMDFNILKTDYTGYSLAYACKSVGPFAKAEFVWINRKDYNTPIAPETLKSLYTVLGENFIDASKLKNSDTSDCLSS